MGYILLLTCRQKTGKNAEWLHVDLRGLDRCEKYNYLILKDV